MTYYLIDFENIQHLSGISTLPKEDEVIFFYKKTPNFENKPTFDLCKDLKQATASITFYPVESDDKNALDFQLSAYIGYLFAKHPEASVTIVSKDKGYLHIVPFLNSLEQAPQITLSDNVGKEAGEEAKEQIPDPYEALREQLAEKGISQEDVECAIQILTEEKEKSTQKDLCDRIHNRLQVELSDKSKYKEVYKIVKAFLGRKQRKHKKKKK